MSNFALRTLTTVIGGAIMVGVILLGREFLLLLLCFASIVGYRELARAFKVSGDLKISSMEITGYISVVLWYALLELGYYGVIPEERIHLVRFCFIVLVFMAHMTVYVLRFPQYDASRTLSSFVSVIYCPVLLSFVYIIRSLDKGLILVWMVFVCSWICDTSAYLVGIRFGRHKMSPGLSPKKSVEGAVGGIAGSLITGCLYAAFLIAPSVDTEKWKVILLIAVMSVCGALISMVGDLAASAIKRDHDIKDYGNLLPGHGGIMDRVDSVIFVAPVVYMLCLVIK